MKNQKLSRRQLDTLRSIHDFELANCLPPTIGDLKRSLGVTSDQSVIELLKRLEGKGLIERTPNQARGRKLTNEGRLALGVPTANSSPDASAFDRGLELNPQQKRIIERLTEIEPRFAAIYQGGLRVLLDQGNPERIAQSAHSIRESTAKLSDAGKDLLTQGDKDDLKRTKGSNNARQLEKLFDPLGGVRSTDQSMYDFWNKEFHQFFIEVSHHGKLPSIDEYRQRLRQYEEFLDSYVLPRQIEIYDHIDKMLAEEPGVTDPSKLEFLLTRNVASNRYFFRNVDARWFGHLRQHNFLKPTWEIADYLARIARANPEAVMDVVVQMISQADWATQRSLVEAACNMPPEIGCRLVSELQRAKWFKARDQSWLGDPLIRLLRNLVKSSLHDKALQLVALLLGIKDTDTSASNAQNTGLNYDRECLNELVHVSPTELPGYIRLLAKSLSNQISAERLDDNRDLSSIWRPAIENDDENYDFGDLKNLLVTAIRRSIERWTDFARPTAAEIDVLFSDSRSYSIFKRLRLYLYRIQMRVCMPQTDNALVEDIDNWEVWYEYAALLAAAFPIVSPSVRAKFLNALEVGPTDKSDQNRVRSWKITRISTVRPFLSPAETTRFAQFLESENLIEHPDFLSYGPEVMIGPTSPIGDDDLRAMPIDVLVEQLATWTPVRGRPLDPSREGLGRRLSAVVTENVEAFSAASNAFADPRIRPVYVHHFFCGLNAAIKNDRLVNWDVVLGFALGIVRRSRSDELPEFCAEGADGEWEAKWDGVLSEIAGLVESGLKNRKVGVPFELRHKVWETISFLCKHSNPTPEYETRYGGNNMNPYTLSLNTVRGRATHALIEYIFWCDRHLIGAEFESRIPAEAKAVLQNQVKCDESLTVRSVLGRYFPWLYTYDSAWATTLIPDLFPEHTPVLRYAAWETYLAGDVFPKVYQALTIQYELAISEMKSRTKDRQYWADPVQRLAHHMMICYVYGINGSDFASKRFFEIASGEQRGIAVSFGGRAYITRKPTPSQEVFPDLNRLQQFWEWRLNNSKDIVELREFGWWVSDGRFNDQWMLDRLIETLTKTRGVIEAGYHVLSALANLTSIHPGLCSRALSLIVTSRSADRWTLQHNHSIEHVIVRLLTSSDADARLGACRMADHLLKLGFEQYRAILSIKRPDPKCTASRGGLHAE